MSNLSLFDLSLEFYALNDLMQDEYDEETGELIDKSEAIEQLYNGIKLSLEDKLDNSKRYLLTLDGETDILDAEIKRLQAKKKALSNKADRLKAMMLNALEIAGGKIKTPLYSFSIRTTESVTVLDDQQIPRSFLKIKYEADKTKIKKAIKEGATVEGAKLSEKKSLNVR